MLEKWGRDYEGEVVFLNGAFGGWGNNGLDTDKIWAVAIWIESFESPNLSSFAFKFSFPSPALPALATSTATSPQSTSSAPLDSFSLTGL